MYLKVLVLILFKFAKMVRFLQELMAEKVRLELDSKKLRGDLTAALLRIREEFPGLYFPSSVPNFRSSLIGRWVTKLVARLLAIAALWIRIHSSLKNTKWAT
jgi:hypothetical protein